MKARWGRPIALVLGAALVLAFLRSQRPHPPEAAAATGAPARVVRVAAVEEQDVPAVREAVGTVRSRGEVAIEARVMAKVLEVAVSAGDEVRAGDPLLALEAAGARAAVAEAEAVRVAREKALEEAQRELQRTRTLFEREARTQSELDAATTALEGARAMADAAREAVAAARVALDDTALVAPFDGVVMGREVDPGDLAVPGKTLLRLFDPAALRLEVALPASLFGGIALGDELEVRIDAVRLGGDEPVVPSRVEEIVPAVDSETRTALVKLALPPDPRIRPGMFGRAWIPVGVRRALVVPSTAVVVRGQLEVVFTVADEGRARMHVVRSGRGLRGGQVELLSGLTGPQRVVVDGADELRDGVPVRVEGS